MATQFKSGDRVQLASDDLKDSVGIVETTLQRVWVRFPDIDRVSAVEYLGCHVKHAEPVEKDDR